MAKKKGKGGGLVYSTDRGRVCPGCGDLPGNCRCGKNSVTKSDGFVRISRETKGRKGSGVSLISGLTIEAAELKILAKLLKAKCGSGGTIKNGVIEIQGDHREFLKEQLEKQGYKVKLAGS
ncbi:MAG: translation initiation factor Sui1 [Desulfurivibrionaceae bacterium]